MIKSFFSLLLIVLLFLSSLGYAAHRVKDPDFLTEQARNANLYGRLTTTLPKTLDDKMFESSGFSKEDLTDVVTAAIDSTTFYSFTEAAAQAYLPWLTGEEDNLSFRYDLAPVKATARDRAVDRMLARYAALPLCTSEQVKAWSTEQGLPSCQLPSNNVRSNDVARLFGEQVDTFLNQLPPAIGATENAQLREIRGKVSLVLRAIQLIWIITFVVFFLFLALLRRHAFLSLAFVFLLTGLVEALFGLVAWDWVGKLVIDSMPTDGNGVLPVAIDLVTTVLDVLKRSLSTLSVALIVLGAAFLFCWIFFRPRPKSSTVPSR